MQYSHLRNLDPSSVCYEQAQPRLLIGSDNWELIVTRELLTGRRYEPAASRTELGWVIHGSAPRATLTREEEHVLHIRTGKRSKKASRDRLDALDRSDFELDAIGISLNMKISNADVRASKDRRSPPTLNQKASMIFGARSSPFLTHSVRNTNAHEYEQTHPKALRAISEHMDDTEHEAIEHAKSVSSLHEQDGFILRGWNSSSQKVLATIPGKLRAPEPTHLQTEHSNQEPTLRCCGYPSNTLAFNTAMNRVTRTIYSQNRPPIKTEALSAFVFIFDPFGLLSQYTTTAKILLQNLWRLEVKWDEPLPTEITDDFSAWHQNLKENTELRLPRHYNTRGARSMRHTLCCQRSSIWSCALLANASLR